MKHVLSFLIVLASVLAIQARTAVQLNEKLVETYGVPVVINGRNYYIGSEFQDFEYCYRVCVSLGMDLMSLETKEEDDAVKNYLAYNGYGGMSYWTSGRRLANGQTFYWTAVNKAFTYTGWNEPAFEPDYAGPGDACVRVGPTTGWVDTSCDVESKSDFVCEQVDTK